MKDVDSFHHQFIDQCEREMAQRGLTQKALAVLMGVSEARVSQVFRNPANLWEEERAMKPLMPSRRAPKIKYQPPE
jgi:predicted XRE-type DNA-binding protein